MNTETSRERAGQIMEEALQEQMAQRYENAVQLYKRSIAVYPTAEAHTFLGWAYSYLDRLDEAIDECRHAIALDPDFGNPYNDIGSYLMKQGKLDDAVAWLEKAKQASRYEPRHYPYLNLARLYAAQGRFEEAQRELHQARFLHDELFGKDGQARATGSIN
ncbi:MAG: tetratricopeptide repeat protein [Candidatus Polarisedimenticolia bacterium]